MLRLFPVRTQQILPAKLGPFPVRTPHTLPAIYRTLQLDTLQILRALLGPFLVRTHHVVPSMVRPFPVRTCNTNITSYVEPLPGTYVGTDGRKVGSVSTDTTINRYTSAHNR